MNEWHSLAADGSARWLTYSFGVGTANTLASRLPDGSWAVISPARGLPDAAFEALRRDGPVSALIAPNGFHHLGQPEWRAQFPGAVSYAPVGSLSRLAKKAPSVPFRPLSELLPRLGDGLTLVEPDGMKIPDLLASARTAQGNVWFAGDLISNTQPGDVKFPARLIFALLGGGTGLRYNPVPAMIYLKDRKAWKRSAREHLEASAPIAVLPAHGAPITEDATARVRAALGG